MLHQVSHYAVSSRLESFRRDSKAAQLKRVGYRDIREPRILRHWANR